MSLAIFDLDNTLIAGDSDYSWGQFLVEKSLVNAESFKKANDQFYKDYKEGVLDIFEYLEFALAPLAEHSMTALHELRQEFFDTVIQPMQLKKAAELISEHKEKRHTLLVITATNLFVVEPIIESLGIKNVLATNPEITDNRYTGKVSGTPCFQEGKVVRLREWLQGNDITLENSYFYSDSINDLPLLKEVTNPVAVDPDEKLTEEAKHREWPIISLR